VAASKKKKQAKLKRTLKKAKRDLSVARSEGDKQAVFAALQLLNDPQGFAEKLFARVQVCPHWSRTKCAI
jgi:protein SDA1